MAKAEKKEVIKRDYMYVPPLSDEKRKLLFPTQPPLTLRELKARKNGKGNDSRKM